MSARIVFLGMLGILSAIPFERLLAGGADIRAVIVPAPHAGVALRPLPLAAPMGAMRLQPAQAHVLDIARERGVPAWTVSDLRHPDSLASLRALQPELLLVSCFRHILPPMWLKEPEHGSWNLHPSLLPRLRGPDPLFWTFHDSAPPGVSVHRMSALVDAGPIVAQTPLSFPDGMRYAEAERLCGEAGAELFRRGVAALERGTLSALSQREADASYFPLPGPPDWVVSEDWTVRRAFNFVSGVLDRGSPVLRVARRDFNVRKALDFREGETIAEAWQISEDVVTVRLADGLLRAVYAAE